MISQRRNDLEEEKKLSDERITSYSSGGATYVSVNELMQKIETNETEIVNIENELSELKNLIEKYDNQYAKSSDVSKKQNERKKELETFEQEYEKEVDEWTKMLFIQKHTAKGKEKENKRIELRKKILTSKNEIELYQTDVMNEEYVLEKIKEEIMEKIKLLQKNDKYKNYFNLSMPGAKVSFDASYTELLNFVGELEKVLKTTKELVMRHETEIVNELNMPAGSIVTPDEVLRQMDQIVSIEQQKTVDLEKALLYSEIEYQQPSYFNDLEAGIKLADEISSRKK